jgi:hypothetical protein
MPFIYNVDKICYGNMHGNEASSDDAESQSRMIDSPMSCRLKAITQRGLE